jgi:hypothetical protein
MNAMNVWPVAQVLLADISFSFPLQEVVSTNATPQPSLQSRFLEFEVILRHHHCKPSSHSEMMKRRGGEESLKFFCQAALH